MGLIKCIDCKKRISDSVSECPKCGSKRIEDSIKLSKKPKYGCLILMALIVGVLVLIFNNSDNNDKKNEKRDTELREKHCSLKWSELSKNQKDTILNEFIDNSFAIDQMFQTNLYQALSQSVKYPSTLKVDGNKTMLLHIAKHNTKITNTNKGTLQYYNTFTSENKLGMEVKGSITIDMKYNAECKKVKVLNIKIE